MWQMGTNRKLRSGHKGDSSSSTTYRLTPSEPPFHIYFTNLELCEGQFT